MISRYRTAIAFACLAALPLAGCDTLSGLFDFETPDPILEGERVPIMAANFDIAVDPQLADMDVTLPAPAANSEWLQPGERASNKIGHLLAPGTLQPVWQQRAGRGTDSYAILTATPIIAGGVVYVLDANAQVFAFDAMTGTRIWSRSMAIAGETDPQRNYGGGLAFEGEKLFVATGFRRIWALNAANGADLWNVQALTPVHNAPVAADGRLYVVTQENRLMVINTADGAILWEHQGIVEPASIASSTNVAVAGDTVIVPYSSGELFALRVDNGVPYWGDQLTRTGNVTALTVLNDISGRPVVDGDMVFAVSHSGTLVAINIRTGGRVWTRNIASIQTPFAAGDFLFVITTEGQVICLTRADGRIKWVTQLQAFEDAVNREDPIVWSGPLLVNNRLLLFSSDGRAVSLVPSTGDLANQIAIPSGTFIPPVMANGTMYVLTNQAQLVALR